MEEPTTDAQPQDAASEPEAPAVNDNPAEQAEDVAPPPAATEVQDSTEAAEAAQADAADVQVDVKQQPDVQPELDQQSDMQAYNAQKAEQETLTNMSDSDSGFDLRDFTPAGSTAAAAAAMDSQRLRRILRLEVPVIVKVAEKQLPLGDVINLSPGSIIEFSRSSEQPLQLQVNNKIIGSGAAVKVGEKFGLRINRIAPVTETIRLLGS